MCDNFRQVPSSAALCSLSCIWASMSKQNKPQYLEPQQSGPPKFLALSSPEKPESPPAKPESPPAKP